MGSKLESQGAIALLAGGFCYFLAFCVIVGAPWLLTDGSEHKAMGEDGKEYPVLPYTEQEQAGRDIYGNQVCWHCHSQFVRPVNDEDKRWGPVSRAGESSWDIPHFFGTRRVGPDLAREGGMRIDDWQYAHLWNPRSTVSRSVMPGFTWLFEESANAKRIAHIIDRLDTNGDGIVARQPGTDDVSDPTDEIKSLRLEATSPTLDRWGVLSDLPPGSPKDAPPLDPTHVKWFGYPAGDGLLTDFDARPIPTDRATNLVTYLQKLGTSFPWRKPIYVTAPPRESPFLDESGESLAPPRRTAAMRCYGFHRDDAAKVKAAADATAEWQKAYDAWAKKNATLAARLQRGKELFDANCASCHGAEGRGNGLAAPQLQIRPRDFTSGQFRYRSTVVGKLPLDGDLYRSIARGLPGTAMPSWQILPESQIWLLVDYVKSLNELEKDFNERAAVPPMTPQVFDKNPDKEHLRGRMVYLAAQCSKCHGRQGEADSEWRTAQTPMGNQVRPRDFRPRDAKDVPALRFRGGAAPEDIYRTMITGLDGTGMKGSDEDFFKKAPAPKEGRDDIAKRERVVRVYAAGNELPLQYVTDDSDAAGIAPNATKKDFVELGLKTRKVKDEKTGVDVDQEYIVLQAGDDWALVHYIMWLAGIPIPKPGG